MLPIALAFAVLTLAAGLMWLMWLMRRRGPALQVPAAQVTRAPAEPPRQRAVVLAEAIPAPAAISGEVVRPRALPPTPPVRSSSDALDTLDALLAELESATVRIDGADALDEGSVAELEGLATRLEAAAESLAAH
jgi:hypothetical protein